MTLDMTGLTVPRLAEIRDQMAKRAQEVWGTDINLAADSVLGQILDIMASQSDDLYQLLQALYDSLSPDNASGVFLDNLAGIIGITRNAATRATGTLSCAGTPGTVVPAGQLVRGDDGTVFVTQSTFTLQPATPSSPLGEAIVSAQAEEAGETSAGIGEVTTILTPIAGWATCTNPEAFVSGKSAETDPQLRRRMVLSTQVIGACTDNAIRSKVADLEYVEAAQVISNRTLVTDALGIPGKAFRAVIWPVLVLPERQNEVATIIWQNAPAGIESDGTEVFTVTDQSGYQQTVRYSYAALVTLFTECDIKTTALFPVDGLEQVSRAILYYFTGVPEAEQAALPDLLAAVGTGRSVGDDIIIVDMICAIKTVPGIVEIYLRVDTLNPPLNIGNITVQLDEIAQLPSGNLTVTQI